MHEYRCTRNQPYARGTIGHNDRGARQGYYIVAPSAALARRMMALDFPHDRAGFTAELWQRDVGCSDCGEFHALCQCETRKEKQP